MKKFLPIILFLIGFILIGIEGGNIFSEMGIDIPFLSYKEEKQLPKFIGGIFCLVSIYLFRLSKKRKQEQEQQKINLEKEKQLKWYESLSEEDKIEEDYKKWKSSIGYRYENACIDLLMKDQFDLTPLERKIVDAYMKPTRDALEKERVENEKRFNEKKTRLLNKYDSALVDKIMQDKLWIGMEEEILDDMKGRPGDISESVSKGIIKKKNYYEKSTNRLGNDAFDFEVTLENGKVTGWKDRRNRGTRDI
jgi:hypothetical protein